MNEQGPIDYEKLFVGGGMIVLLSILAALWLTSCNTIGQLEAFLGVPEDNPVEEAIEAIIQKETGIDIDLTPNSPEQNQKVSQK